MPRVWSPTRTLAMALATFGTALPWVPHAADIRGKSRKFKQIYKTSTLCNISKSVPSAGSGASPRRCWCCEGACFTNYCHVVTVPRIFATFPQQCKRQGVTLIAPCPDSGPLWCPRRGATTGVACESAFLLHTLLRMTLVMNARKTDFAQSG
jgi:hypothetical protein